jgi:hypothetical protein
VIGAWSSGTVRQGLGVPVNGRVFTTATVATRSNSACAINREDTWKGAHSECVDHLAAGSAMTMTSATHHECRDGVCAVRDD